jgi:hypothetical protein
MREGLIVKRPVPAGVPARSSLASLETNEPVSGCGGTFVKSVWYAITPQTTRRYMVTRTGGDPTQINVYTVIMAAPAALGTMMSPLFRFDLNRGSRRSGTSFSLDRGARDGSGRSVAESSSLKAQEGAFVGVEHEWVESVIPAIWPG